MLPATFTDKLKTLPQYLIPQHGLSRIVRKLTRLRGGWVTQWIIKYFIRYYAIDMQLAVFPHVKDYSSFNQFFTRALQPSTRPIDDAPFISPVDGEISQIGPIEQQTLLQVKGHSFLLNDLFAGHTELSTLFENGLFCTIYLSPKDYHRIHLPMAGRLTDMIYVPGRLFSVNQRTTQVVPNLFSRNERVICVFNTQFGMMALILVGALFVGSMETVWAKELPPHPIKKPQHWQYLPENAPTLQQGQEMGRFNMGSTVIILMQKQRIAWLPECTAQYKLLMGQKLAQCLT